MRPIPVDILPSHVCLSQEDQVTLFGIGCPMTIFSEHTQSGQIVYEETINVFGTFKRSIPLRVMGPNWKQSQVYLTPTESVFLGVKLENEEKTGDLTNAAPCKLVGPEGEVFLQNGAIIPKPHVLCSPEEADQLHIVNGDLVTLEIIAERPHQIDSVIVRVHPTYRLRVELHQDYARSLWITRPVHARVVSSIHGSSMY